MSPAPRLGQSTVAPANAALHDRAADDLRFIRDAMARAGDFTSVSGAGMAAAGAVGTIAAVASVFVPLGRQPGAWLTLWISAAFVAAGISWVAIHRKAARTGQPLSAEPARRFALAFLPAIVAGAVLTAVFSLRGLDQLLPGTWLTLYGAAVAAGGALSVRPVPIMGAAFIALGAICFATESVAASAFLGAGFGGLHLVFGVLIARRHGG